MRMHAQAQMERAVEKDLEMQRKKAADTQEKSDPAVRCGVGGLSTTKETHLQNHMNMLTVAASKLSRCQRK